MLFRVRNRQSLPDAFRRSRRNGPVVGIGRDLRWSLGRTRVGRRGASSAGPGSLRAQRVRWPAAWGGIVAGISRIPAAWYSRLNWSKKAWEFVCGKWTPPTMRSPCKTSPRCNPCGTLCGSRIELDIVAFHLGSAEPRTTETSITCPVGRPSHQGLWRFCLPRQGQFPGIQRIQ